MYLGNYSGGQAVRFLWSTNNPQGEATARTTAGTVQVYRDDGTTESTQGVTDSAAFDGATGLHLCQVATSGSFYLTGHDYRVVLVGAVIDGRTVNADLAEFHIDRERRT